MKNMALMTSLLAALGCGPGSAKEPYVVDGTVVQMDAISTGKHVQGKSPGQGVQLVIKPDQVHHGDTTLSEPAWRAQFADRWRAEQSALRFTSFQGPMPKNEAPGTRVRCTVDDKGFIIDVKPLDDDAK